MKKQLKRTSFKSKILLKNKDNTKSNNTIENINKFVAIFTSSSILFISIFYIAGRQFAAGYFNAMNIPEYMMVFSVNEYSTVSWIWITLFSAFSIFLSLLFYKILFSYKEILILLKYFLLIPLSSLLLSVLRKVITTMLHHQMYYLIYFFWNFKQKNLQKLNKFTYLVFFSKIKNHFLKTKDFIAHLPIQNQKISRFLSILILLSLSVISLIFFFSENLHFINIVGAQQGRKIVISQANVTEIYSITPLPLDNGSTILISSSDDDKFFYVYCNYRLLTKNDGKYYLFKELDPETCKPKQVYIIDESKIDQVILSPAEDISDQCNAPVNP